jgi:hypothetical protein
MRSGNYDVALKLLAELESSAPDLPSDMALRIYFDRACSYSMQAQKMSDTSQDDTSDIDNAMTALKRWSI